MDNFQFHFIPTSFIRYRANREVKTIKACQWYASCMHELRCVYNLVLRKQIADFRAEEKVTHVFFSTLRRILTLQIFAKPETWYALNKKTKRCTLIVSVWSQEKQLLDSRFRKRNVEETQKLMKCAAKKSPVAKELQQYFAKKFLLPVLLFLSNFLFAVIHLAIPVYSFIRYEPMHSLSSRVGRNLKECIVYMLSDGPRLNLAMRCQNENIRSLRFIRRIVLSTLNASLERYSSNAHEHGLKIEFS